MNSSKLPFPKISIWQIYYNKDGFKALDPDFIPYSNYGKETLFLENEVILDVWNQQRELWINSDYVGVVSWRFKEKTDINYDHIVYHIMSNGRKDVFSMTPVKYNHNPSPFSGMSFWNILPICKIIDKYELFPFKLTGYNSKGRYRNFCNYFICKPEIFDDYVKNYLHPLYLWLQTCKDPDLLEYIKVMVNHRGGLYPIHPFIIEGLFELYVEYYGYSYEYIMAEDTGERRSKETESNIVRRAFNAKPKTKGSNSSL